MLTTKEYINTKALQNEVIRLIPTKHYVSKKATPIQYQGDNFLNAIASDCSVTITDIAL